MPNFVNKNKFDLRWRFDFTDGRPSKYGIWNHPGVGQNDSAQYCNTSNLARACIEGKDILTKEVRIIAECDGYNFCLFKYQAATRFGFNPRPSPTGKIPARTDLIGLVLVTRDQECLVLTDGSTQLWNRSEYEKNTNYLAYGR